MKVLSTNCGAIKPVSFQGVIKQSSMNRESQPGGIFLSAGGVQGDDFDEKQFHGTDDNKLYALGVETHRLFANELGESAPYPHGSFGENLSMDTLDESQIFMGDVFQIGEARVQATYPRIPCSKLNFRFQNAAALKVFRNLRRPGVYFRVVAAGQIRPGDPLLRVQEDPLGVSILELYDWLTSLKKFPPEFFAKIQKHAAAPAYVRRKIASLG